MPRLNFKRKHNVLKFNNEQLIGKQRKIFPSCCRYCQTEMNQPFLPNSKTSFIGQVKDKIMKNVSRCHEHGGDTHHGHGISIIIYRQFENLAIFNTIHCQKDTRCIFLQGNTITLVGELCGEGNTTKRMSLGGIKFYFVERGT